MPDAKRYAKDREYYLAFNAKRYQDFKDRGLCGICGLKMTEGAACEAICVNCSERNAESKRRLRSFF